MSATWRIQNLVACADHLHRRLWEASDPAPVGGGAAAALGAIADEAAEHVATVDRLAREAGALVTQLPTPSLQAYGWMFWLCADPEHPGAQTDSLRRLRRIGRELGEPLSRAELKPMRVLLRSKRRPAHFELQVNGLFIGAPDEVLEAVYQRGRGRARPLDVDRIDDYARGPVAQALHQAMCAVSLAENLAAGRAGPLAPGTEGPTAGATTEARAGSAVQDRTAASPAAGTGADAPGKLSGADRPPAAGEAPLGRYHDLRAVFHRVNQHFFQGHLAQPRLRWSSKLNRTHLGHYRPLEDELQVSAILDRRDVPPEVLDYLMFHELLHKALGISTTGGRRRSHTPAFRAAEAQFPHYDRVQRWLRRHL